MYTTGLKPAIAIFLKEASKWYLPQYSQNECK